mgnify:CR=1 FL=1
MTHFDIEIFRRVFQALLKGAEQQKPEVLERVERWMCQERTGLLLVGSVGTGKSTIAAAMCRCWSDLTTVARYAQCDLIADRIKQDESYKYEVALHKGLLVLDDLGTEATVYGQESLPFILYRRYERSLPTIITTNLAREGILQRYGERIADRLRTYDQITLNYPSLRR